MTRTISRSALAAGITAAAWFCVSVAGAAPHKELDARSSFEAADAIKGQDYIATAMTQDMSGLLRQADITHPEAMMEYGLALELGRPSASAQLATDEKEKLKRGYRQMLDLYLDSGDKFGKVKFTEDAMLDVPDFWINLAEHIGRPKPRVDVRSLQEAAMNQSSGNPADMSQMVYMPDDTAQDKEFNLNADLVLNRHVVNAVWSCAQSARTFARLQKVQLLDPSQTKLTPAQFANAMSAVVNDYRLAYQEGLLACGSREAFFRVADFARGNLGPLGGLKEAPGAQPAPLGAEAAPETAKP